jgi:hypothetical protein
LIETAAADHFLNASAPLATGYWRDGEHEVDLVVRASGAEPEGHRVLAVRVESGRRRPTRSGLGRFLARFPESRSLVVGHGGVEVADFLARPAPEWLS